MKVLVFAAVLFAVLAMTNGIFLNLFQPQNNGVRERVVYYPSEDYYYPGRYRRYDDWYYRPSYRYYTRYYDDCYRCGDWWKTKK